MIAIMPIPIDRHFGRFSGQERRFETGEILFRRDDPVRWLHLVKDGTLHLVRYGRDGTTCVLQRVGAGGFLAEASLFSPRYHCDAVSVSAARLTRFSKQHVIDAMSNDPDFAFAWAAYLSAEVQRVRVRAEILSQRTVAARLDSWLALNGDELPPSGQRVGLATDIGVSPEALYRLLSKRRRVPPRPG